MNLYRIAQNVLTAVAALEVAAVLLVSVATPAHAPEPKQEPTGVTVCGEDVEDNEVTRIAADEISRLASEGYPVCEAEWGFTDTLTDYLGLAYDNNKNFILLNTTADLYTRNDKPLDAKVRHVVRHEFG